MSSLATLLGMDFREVQEVLVDLHTTIHIDGRSTSLILLHHPTFRDFLLDRNRCHDRKFWVDRTQMHKAVAKRCIDIIYKMLKQNICSLDSQDALVKDIEPDRIERCIPSELQYACLHWVKHYRQSGNLPCDGDEVHLFLHEHFLHWTEVISLLGKIPDLTSILRMYHSLLVVSCSYTVN